MLTQRIFVKNVFLCSRVYHKFFRFATTKCFMSLNRTFIWLFNDINLKYILKLPYFILLKNGSYAIQPERCCLTLSQSYLHSAICRWESSWSPQRIVCRPSRAPAGLTVSSGIIQLPTCFGAAYPSRKVKTTAVTACSQISL